MSWISVRQAAPKMGLKERQARNRLVAIQSRHPRRELLRPCGDPQKRVGKYLVNTEVLEELVRLEQESDLDELDERVGSLESLERIIRKRLGRLEKEVFGGKHAEQIADLEQRLRQLAALCGNEKQ